jgi:hypothetical protein
VGSLLSFALSSPLSAALLLAFCWAAPVFAGDFTALCVDRAALERVYHAHRLGTKPDFDQAMPRALLERLVRLDLKKEAVLKQGQPMGSVRESLVGANYA